MQNGCLHGLLYISEDAGSHVMPQVGPLLGKYVISRLENFHRFVSSVGGTNAVCMRLSALCCRHTELHVRLLWALAISLVLIHSQHLK